MKALSSMIAGAAMLGLANIAAAAEPMALTDAQLDSVSAAGYSGFYVSGYASNNAYVNGGGYAYASRNYAYAGAGGYAEAWSGGYGYISVDAYAGR
ncbi:MAG: hypothetical protein ACFCVA_15465 [Gammaproteobacteria bacterium]